MKTIDEQIFDAILNNRFGVMAMESYKRHGIVAGHMSNVNYLFNELLTLYRLKVRAEILAGLPKHAGNSEVSEFYSGYNQAIIDCRESIEREGV